MAVPVPLVLTPVQRQIFRHPARFKVVSAGRRLGKTWVIIGDAFINLLYDRYGKPAQSRNLLYVGRTYGDAKRLMYKPFCEYLENLQRLNNTRLIANKSDSDLMVRLVNGSTLRCAGGEATGGLRGDSLDKVYGDEFAFANPEVWPTVRPALSDRKGGALLVSSPAGYNHFKDLWDLGDPENPNRKPDWMSFQFTTIQGGNVDQEEVDAAREILTAAMFRQEYLASFENLDGRVYYNFDYIEHCHELRDDGVSPLYVGMDFNRHKMYCCVAQIVEDQLHVFDELSNRLDTQEIADHLNMKYPGRQIIVCPDASGGNGKTVGETDHATLKNAGLTLWVDKANPRVPDRVNEVNAMFKNANGDYRIFINRAKCPALVKALMGQTYDKSGDPDKSGDLDHPNDALGYLVHQTFPMLNRAAQVLKWR
jgi:hypothetical protein